PRATRKREVRRVRLLHIWSGGRRGVVHQCRHANGADGARRVLVLPRPCDRRRERHAEASAERVDRAATRYDRNRGDQDRAKHGAPLSAETHHKDAVRSDDRALIALRFRAAGASAGDKLSPVPRPRKSISRRSRRLPTHCKQSAPFFRRAKWNSRYLLRRLIFVPRQREMVVVCRDRLRKRATVEWRSPSPSVAAREPTRWRRRQ